MKGQHSVLYYGLPCAASTAAGCRRFQSLRNPGFAYEHPRRWHHCNATVCGIMGVPARRCTRHRCCVMSQTPMAPLQRCCCWHRGGAGNAIHTTSPITIPPLRIPPRVPRIEMGLLLPLVAPDIEHFINAKSVVIILLMSPRPPLPCRGNSCQTHRFSQMSPKELRQFDLNRGPADGHRDEGFCNSDFGPRNFQHNIDQSYLRLSQNKRAEEGHMFPFHFST